jgi:hypothetical protein
MGLADGAVDEVVGGAAVVPSELARNRLTSKSHRQLHRHSKSQRERLFGEM